MLRTTVADHALTLLRDGDSVGHDRLIAEAAARLEGCDAVMLAQFSMASAADAVRQTVSMPVLDSPSVAVTRLRTLVEGGAR
jgi:Asp/Glu/hydantoin racemase